MHVARLMALALSLIPVALLAADGPPVVSLAFEGNLKNTGTLPFEATAFGDEITFDPIADGQAVFIGGTEDWIDVAVDDRLSFENGASLEFWFCRLDWTNPYRAGSSVQILAAVDGLWVSVRSSSLQLRATVGSYAANTDRVELAVSPGPVDPDRWYHVALVYDAVNRSTTTYLDGKRIESKTGTPTMTGHRVNPLRIGTWYKANLAFRGWIDDLRLYDYPRTADQIRDSNGLERRPDMIRLEKPDPR